MANTDAQARQELLDGVAEATDALGHALTALGAAYEQLDEQQADRLEEELFRPLQLAYGRAKRTYSEFARRYGLSARDFTTPAPGPPSTGVKGFVEEAIDAIGRAETELVTLQDSLMPVEFGDPELRGGMSEVRRMIDGLIQRAHQLVRTFGR